MKAVIYLDVVQINNSLHQLGITNLESIRCLEYHTMAIDENGYLQGCANNNLGQLGLGTCKKQK